MDASTIRPILVTLSGVIFFISLTLPAINNTMGYTALLIGWFSMFDTQFGSLAWLANVFIPMAWIGTLISSRPLAFVPSILGVIFAVEPLVFTKVIVEASAGASPGITSYHLGYWLWLLSSFLVLIAALSVPRKFS
jgi:hypothetical protein